MSAGSVVSGPQRAANDQENHDPKLLKKNLLANYLGQGWTALIGLAFIPVYIRFLGVEAYGLIGLFAVLQAWLSLLDMGLTPTLAREMGRFTGGEHTAASIRDLLRSIEAIAFVLIVVISGGIGLGAPWLASSWLQAENLPVPVVAQAFAIMGVVTALRFLEGIYRSSIVGLQRQVLFNVINSSMATLRSLGAVAVLAWVAPTIQAFFLWQGVVSVGTIAALATATYASLPAAERPAQFSINALRRVGAYAGGMTGIMALTLLLTKIDKLLLSRLLSLTDYGYYMLATVVAGTLYMLVAPITQAWFPKLAQLHASANQAGFARTYHQGAQLVAVLVGSAALVLMAFADTFLNLWTQDADLAINSAPLVQILVLGNLLNALMWIPYQTQLATGWTGLTLRINLVAVVVIVPAIFWATPRYGAQGAAWVWVVLNAGYLLVGVQLMFRRILTAERWLWYREDVIQPLVGAIVAVAAVRILAPATGGTKEQLITLCCGAVTALGASALVAPAVRTPLISGVRRTLVALSARAVSKTR